MPKIFGSHHTDPAIRALISDLAATGLLLSEIASLVNVSISTVQRSIKHGKERGHHQDAPRSGRPPKLDERSLRHLNLILERDRRQPLCNVTSAVNNFLSSPVAPRTIQRTIHAKLDMSSCMACKKPYLDPKHRLERKKWAQEKLGWDMTNWSRVIWTDEATVEIGKESRAIRVWRRAGERYKESCLAPTFKSGRQSLMVWGCMAYGRLGPLIRIPKDQKKAINYINLVLAGPLWDVYSELYEERGVVKVVEDGAPVHTAMISRKFRTDHHIDTLEHPAQSPDVNPIEHVWKHLKVMVNKRLVRPRNLEELWEALSEEWAKIDIEFINRLVESMPNRVQAVYSTQGGPTKY
jgi:transposase